MPARAKSKDNNAGQKGRRTRSTVSPVQLLTRIMHSFYVDKASQQLDRYRRFRSSIRTRKASRTSSQSARSSPRERVFQRRTDGQGARA